MGHVFRTEEQQMAVDGLRRYLDAELEPALKKHGERFIPRQTMAGFMRELVKYGLICAPAAEANGGMGLDWFTHLMLFEELVYSSADVASPVIINTVAADLLAKLAPEHLKRRYLPGLLQGELFACAGISEPDVGSNVAEVKTRARRDGDHYVVSGEKVWITNGEYSDFMICTCRTSDDPKRGLTHILLDRREQPYEVRGIDKIALNGQSFVLGASAGAAFAPAHGADAEVLLKRALLSLRQAKRVCRDDACRAAARAGAVRNRTADGDRLPVVVCRGRLPGAVRHLERRVRSRRLLGRCAH